MRIGKDAKTTIRQIEKVAQAQKIFGERIRQMRLGKGATQQATADATGISKTNYQDYEYGKKFPGFTTLPLLADYFDVSIDYLLGRTDVPQVVRSAQWQVNPEA